MTATARTISAGNLHERLAISGPEDEFRQLGDTIDDLLARLEASFAPSGASSPMLPTSCARR